MIAETTFDIDDDFVCVFGVFSEVYVTKSLTAARRIEGLG